MQHRGGRGIGVRLWRDVSYFEKYLDTEFAREVPVDGILLLQVRDFRQSHSPLAIYKASISLHHQV